MRILLDTHVLLWWLDDDSRLSNAFREAIRNPRNEIWVSAVSLAEIAVKQAVDKLDAPYISSDLIAEQGMSELSFQASHGRKMRELPLLHRDPFDRMLIAQAIEEDLVVATVDEQFTRYDVRRI